MKPGHTLEVVRFEERQYRVLYMEGRNLQVMNESTFEQYELPLDLFESDHQRNLVSESTYMEEPPEVTVLYYKEEALSCKLPPTLELVVDKAFAGISKQSASTREKDSFMQGGMLVKVKQVS